MLKTQEELNELKNEYELVTNKLQDLTEDELGYVTGGLFDDAIATIACDIFKCNLNPDACTVKKNGVLCPKEKNQVSK